MLLSPVRRSDSHGWSSKWPGRLLCCQKGTPGSAASPNRLKSLEILSNGREQVRPFVVNIPEEDRLWAEVQLERWFRGTQELSRALWLEPQLDFEATAAAYRNVLTRNPADQNARFLWNRYLARAYHALAQRSLAAGEPDEAVGYLNRAVAASPDTLPGAQAGAMLESFRIDWRRPRGQ